MAMKIIQGLHNYDETQGNICEAEISIKRKKSENFNSSFSAMISVGRMFVSSHKFRTRTGGRVSQTVHVS